MAQLCPLLEVWDPGCLAIAVALLHRRMAQQFHVFEQLFCCTESQIFHILLQCSSLGSETARMGRHQCCQHFGLVNRSVEMCTTNI